jgi:hypothetical protein
MKSVRVKVWTVMMMDGKERKGTEGYFLDEDGDGSPTER